MGAWLGWTDQNKAEATRRWIEGASARDICQALHAPSRSAVIGILHRMGVERDTPVGKAKEAPRFTAPVRPSPPRPAVVRPARPAPLPAVAAAPSGGKHLVELRATDCRYPIAGAGADTRYCGGFAVDPTHPWCREHEAVVFKAPQP